MPNVYSRIQRQKLHAATKLSNVWCTAVGCKLEITRRSLSEEEAAEVKELNHKPEELCYVCVSLDYCSHVLTTSAFIDAKHVEQGVFVVWIKFLCECAFLPDDVLESPAAVKRTLSTLTDTAKKFNSFRNSLKLCDLNDKLVVESFLQSFASRHRSLSASISEASLLPSHSSSFDSDSEDEEFKRVWTPGEVAHCFILVRKVARRLHLQMKFETQYLFFGKSKDNDYAPFNCSIMITNFFPHHFKVVSCGKTFEEAQVFAANDFCELLAINHIISYSMFEAWNLLGRGASLAFEPFAEVAKQNFEELDHHLPKGFLRTYGNTRQYMEIKEALHNFAISKKKNDDKSTEYFFKVAQSERFNKPAERNDFGIIPNFSNTKLFMEKLSLCRQNFEDEFTSFDKEIDDFIKEHEEPPEYQEKKHKVYCILQNYLRSRMENAILHMVGSTANGTATGHADLDLVLEKGSSPDRNYSLDCLRDLYHILQKSEFVFALELIPASVPILKLVLYPPFKDITIEISCNAFHGVATTTLIQKYVNIHVICRNLIILVKEWAKAAGISRSGGGEIGSIALIIMVIHFLQSGCEHPVLPNLQSTSDNPRLVRYEHRKNGFLHDFLKTYGMPAFSCGQYFVAFFEYYSKFEFDQHGISLESGGIFNRDELSFNADTWKIFIEEPFKKVNILRTICQKESYEKIQKAFRDALITLTSDDIEHSPPKLAKLMVQRSDNY